MLTGENGILNKAIEAKEITEEAEKNEENILNSYEDIINDYVGIDWDTVLANAEMHPNQKTSTAIGVGTDGRAVNMDLWNCVLLDDGTYALSDNETLNNGTRTPGYHGQIIDGRIEGTIPQYIKSDTDNEFIKVTSLRSMFYGISDLIEAPVIPSTVTHLKETFQDTGLKEMPEIPKGVIDMTSTFYGCTNLSELKDIPDTVTDISYCFADCTSLTNINIELGRNVINMRSTFAGCSKLISINKLPDNVINLQGTFTKCSNLEIAPVIPDTVNNMCTTFQNCENLENVQMVIPSSVKNMQWTFQYCTKISGQITVNAELTGTIINGYEDYFGCFVDCATDGDGLIISKNSTCPELENLIKTKLTNANITIEE